MSYLYANLTEQLEARGNAEDDASLKISSFMSFSEALRCLERRFAPVVSITKDGRTAIETVPQAFREQAHAAIERGLTKCESPIENAILPWLVVQIYQFFDYNPAVLFAGETDQYKAGTIAVIPQLPIGRFRADFALAGSISAGPVRFVIIECDGKEFHDGVKNVIRDVNRDVAILANPRVLDVVRIGGSEIMRDPCGAGRIAARGVLEAWAKKLPKGRVK